MPDLFIPAAGGGATVRLEVGTDTARIAIPVPAKHATIRVAVLGDQDVCIAFGGAEIEATLDDMPMLAGSVETFQASSELLYLAAIAAAAGTILAITCGAGE